MIESGRIDPFVASCNYLDATPAPSTASQVRPAPDATALEDLVTVTGSDIARATATPLRTVQHRLSRWHGAGGPVERVPRPDRVGGWQWSVSLSAYCARVGLDPALVLAALEQPAEAA